MTSFQPDEWVNLMNKLDQMLALGEQILNLPWDLSPNPFNTHSNHPDLPPTSATTWDLLAHRNGLFDELASAITSANSDLPSACHRKAEEVMIQNAQIQDMFRDRMQQIQAVQMQLHNAGRTLQTYKSKQVPRFPGILVNARG